MTTNTSTVSECARPKIALAPMAGISDQPFRSMCCAMGADYAVSEMIGADPKFRDSQKTQFRLNLGTDDTPKVVQIAGGNPAYLADAARLAVDHGAEVVDINMGCPSKKVCNQLAGSALLKDEALIEAILTATVSAVAVPVTVKMRTGWDKQHVNAVAVARLAEACGIRGLTIHGRTRACRFAGVAEYDTIARVNNAVSIPVIANGDIRSARQAVAVLEQTGCDGVMIGRGAQGNPWIFRQIAARLNGQLEPAAPDYQEVLRVIAEHLQKMQCFYGEFAVRLARKHVACYAQWLPNEAEFRAGFNQLTSTQAQIRYIDNYDITTKKAQGVLAA